MRTFRITALLTILFSLSAALPILASPRPPTVDPTYGLTPPHLVQPPAQTTGPAHWIWATHPVGDQTVNARASLTLKSAATAALFVTADDAFTLWVNGAKIDATQPIEQGWRQVHKHSLRLHAGVNVIAVQGTNTGGGGAGILVQLDVNGETILQSDSHWKLLESQTPPADWTSATFDDSAWPDATEVAPVGQGPWAAALEGWPSLTADAWYLAHKRIRPVEVETLSGQINGAGSAASNGSVHIVVHTTGSGGPPASMLLDFNQELAGRIVLKGTPGTRVRITTGENRAECSHAEPALDNSGPWDLILASNGEAAAPYTAFRFARLIFSGDRRAVLTRLECDHKYYPVTYKGSFSCSDPVLTKAWYTGAYTAHLCMQETIWDAPKRDRGLWCGDLQVTGESISNAFADRFLMEKSIAGLRSIAQQGHTDTELPTAEVNGLPGYSAAWFCLLADYYRHLGDEAFLHGQHTNILTLLEFQKTDFDANNLFVNPRKNWNFVDWAPDFVVDSPQARMATHLFTIKGVREACFLLRALGDAASADKYSAWADTLTAAAQQHFLDSATGTFGDRLQTNVMAVYSGATTPEQRNAIYTHILQPSSPVWKPPAAQPNLDCYPMTPYYGYFVLRAQAELGKQQDGINLIRRYWGDMLQRGTTTWWEKFDPALPHDFQTILDRMPYLSLSHGWSSGPTTFLSESILGVQPTSGGMKTVDIIPHLGELKWVEGDVPAPQGLIHVRAVKEAIGLALTVKLPAGIDARVGVPGKSIRVNGHSQAVTPDADGMLYVRLNRAGEYGIAARH